MNKYLKVQSEEERALRQQLEKRRDAEAERLKRWLRLPDLTRTPGHLLFEIVQRILKIPRYKNFIQIEAPEIERVDVSFDLFEYPVNHPARSTSDTYYLDKEHILRTHTTTMWYYLLTNERIKQETEKGRSFGAISYGKTYRKDEIDRNHSNVFHQIDGVYFCLKKEKLIDSGELKNVLIEIAQALYGSDVEYGFKKDKFPFTEPSLEMKIKRDGRWVEVLGSGVVNPKVLENLGVDSSRYNGWAFGFGLERLAMVSMNLPDIRLLRSNDPRVQKQLVLNNVYKAVSKYPAVMRDISFIVGQDFIPNEYYDLIRDIGGELVEEVKLIDKYENPAKLKKGQISYTFRIIYRSSDRTLTKKEIEEIQQEIVEQTESRFKATVR